MNNCPWCKELNEEERDIEITGIYIRAAGYYNYGCPIMYCPACGSRLKKYTNEREKETLKFHLDIKRIEMED